MRSRAANTLWIDTAAGGFAAYDQHGDTIPHTFDRCKSNVSELVRQLMRSGALTGIESIATVIEESRRQDRGPWKTVSKRGLMNDASDLGGRRGR